MSSLARPIAEIEQWLESGARAEAAEAHAAQLLRAGEEVLENWIEARGGEPTDKEREGFRLLALHFQGAKGDPSFNACRETCREIVYHYNLVRAEDIERDVDWALTMMRLVTKHLALFIGGKLQEAGLGDFCCSSKALRSRDHALASVVGENHA